MTDSQNNSTTNGPIDKLPSFKPGMIAPNFTLFDENGNEFNLHSNLTKSGEYILLVFYPGDDTPGCTTQLCGIRDLQKEYTNKNIRVIGINHGDSKSHIKFINKYTFQFPILIDTGREISSLYGQIKFMFGHKSIKRGVYLLGKGGEILYKKHGQQDNSEILGLDLD